MGLGGFWPGVWAGFGREFGRVLAGGLGEGCWGEGVEIGGRSGPERFRKILLRGGCLIDEKVEGGASHGTRFIVSTDVRWPSFAQKPAALHPLEKFLITNETTGVGGHMLQSVITYFPDVE